MMSMRGELKNKVIERVLDFIFAAAIINTAKKAIAMRKELPR